MSRNQLRLTLFDDEPHPPPSDAPQVYVASPLTGLTSEARQTVLAWCHIVESAIDEATRGAANPWLVRVHVPARLSAPWGEDGRTDADVYNLNSTTLCTDTDALVVIGYHGGSMGAGQEFEWACNRGIPILYVTSKGDPISRQVRGAPAELTTIEFESPDELRDATTAFLRRCRRTIEDGPRRRASLRLRLTPVVAELRVAWKALPVHRQREVAAIARLHPRRIATVLGDPLALAALSAGRTLALAAALRICFLPPPLALPELQLEQLRALFNAQAEYDWSDALALELANAARLELARGGVRRFRLTTIDDWHRFSRLDRQ